MNDPVLIDRVLRRGRERYLALRPLFRPGRQPCNVLGVFTPTEMRQLARCGAWPLRRRQLRYVCGEVPANAR